MQTLCAATWPIMANAKDIFYYLAIYLDSTSMKFQSVLKCSLMHVIYIKASLLIMLKQT